MSAELLIVVVRVITGPQMVVLLSMVEVVDDVERALEVDVVADVAADRIGGRLRDERAGDEDEEVVVGTHVASHAGTPQMSAWFLIRSWPEP